MRQQQDRIDAIQKRLDEKGIIDIKFFFDNEVPVTPETLEEILVILELHTRGESKPLEAIGDKLLEYALP